MCLLYLSLILMPIVIFKIAVFCIQLFKNFVDYSGSGPIVNPLLDFTEVRILYLFTL